MGGPRSAYVDWLEAELVALIEADPDVSVADSDEAGVDLVGHDWGAGHVMGLVAERPDLVRTWAVDCGGLLNPDYVWHDSARQWQTPGVGEELVEAMVAIPVADRAEIYRGLGLTDDMAATMAGALTAEMGRCILDLYRSAAQPALADLSAQLDATLERLGDDRPPVLIIDAVEDGYVPSELAQSVISRLDADSVKLTAGHWWMADHAAVPIVADALVEFWH